MATKKDVLIAALAVVLAVTTLTRCDGKEAGAAGQIAAYIWAIAPGQ